MWPVLFGVALLAGVTAAGIGALSLADALTATGLPDPGPGHHLRPAVRAGRGRDRRRGRRRVVPVRGVPRAAAAERGARRRRLPRAAARHRRLGGVDGVRGAAGAADRLRRLRSAVARPPQPVGHLVGGRPGRHRGRLAVDGVPGGDRDRREHPGAALVAGRRCCSPDRCSR